MRFPGSGRSEEYEVVAGGDEVQVPRCALTSRRGPRVWSKSNSSRDLRAGNRAARMRPPLTDYDTALGLTEGAR
jgi:hypothetical protein